MARDMSRLKTEVHHQRAELVVHGLQIGPGAQRLALAAQGLVHQTGKRYPSTIGITKTINRCCGDSELLNPPDK